MSQFPDTTRDAWNLDIAARQAYTFIHSSTFDATAAAPYTHIFS